MAFLKGFVMGLGMTLLIGPVFFTLLKSTLQYGFRGGFLVAAGIFASDVTCVILCSFGAIPFFKNTENQFWLAIGGSIILLALGLKYLFNPVLYTDSAVTFKSHHYPTFFAKGFLVNFVNPFVFLVWISLIGFGEMRFGISGGLAAFLSGVLSAIFLTDCLKVFFAHRIKGFIKPNILLPVYRVIGIVMIAFGIRLVWTLF